MVRVGFATDVQRWFIALGAEEHLRPVKTWGLLTVVAMQCLAGQWRKKRNLSSP
jgi:hypothetical protein